MTRVAFIHALRQSLAPLDEEMDRQWPDSEGMHLLDGSLASDLATSPHGLDARFDARMMQLAEYAVRTGAAGILFTCSAFGRCIEHVPRRLAPLPVLEPNEAMVDEAVASGGRLGPVATFAPTLTSMVAKVPEGRSSMWPTPRERWRHSGPATGPAAIASSCARTKRWCARDAP